MNSATQALIYPKSISPLARDFLVLRGTVPIIPRGTNLEMKIFQQISKLKGEPGWDHMSRYMKKKQEVDYRISCNSIFKLGKDLTLRYGTHLYHLEMAF